MPHDTTIDFEAIKAPPQVDVTETLAPIKQSVAKLRQMSGVQEKKIIKGFVRDPEDETIGGASTTTFVETEVRSFVSS